MLKKHVAYFQYSLLLKIVYMKAETIMPGVAHYFGLTAVIMACRNFGIVDGDLDL